MTAELSIIGSILAAAGLLAVSGLASLVADRASTTGQRATTGLVVFGSALGLCGVTMAFAAASPPELAVPWSLPWGRFALRVDALSALFLVPVFVIPMLGSIYGLGYWKHSEHPESGRRLACSFGILAGAMAIVTIAADAVLFLIAWEVMALAAYFAATVEEDDPAVRRAGWVYLVATHAGTLCLLAAFALWRQATGSFALAPAAGGGAELAGAIFVLSILGFGFKAGLVPLHVWLPGAHANAPSHVSAVMSGVMLKMGVYGIVRMTALLPAGPTWWGGTLLFAGIATGLLGIGFAIAQSDLKRLLAYSSIENVGIIAIGVGLALLGRTLDRDDWVLLGLAGALLHVWNHALFKSLLFLCAGAILHAAGTRDIDRLGGLARRMPRTTIAFAVGAVAISGLPPLNGFVSEWLVYLASLRTIVPATERTLPVAAVAAVALATIGALAVACFVKVFGAVFLGSARTAAGERAHDPFPVMLAPLALLAVSCVAIGALPMAAAAPLERAVAAWAGHPGLVPGSLAAIAPLDWIGALGATLLAASAAVFAAVTMRSWACAPRTAVTWDCGYAQPTTRMQYTGSSFGEPLARLFALVLWPKVHEPVLHGPFPRRERFRSIVPDTFLDRGIVPLFRFAGRHLPRLRVLQQGQTQWYVLYVLVTMIVLLAWSSGDLPP